MNTQCSANIVPTEYWHRLPDGRVQCDLCPRYCKLKDQQRGLCFVRQNIAGAVVMTSYGRSSGFCVDPIEKKPLKHFYPGTAVLSFGTAGCNLACKFCQNWDISKSREIDTLADDAAPDKLARVAQQLNCKSVAYTYNDPIIFLEYARDVAHACTALGIYNVAVTAGYICPQPRIDFFQFVDAANVDLKGFSERFYHKICGGHLQNILETLDYLHTQTQVWLELTTLLIPGENDSEMELHQMSQWVFEHLGADVPWHFNAFHPDWKMLQHPATPPQTLSRARAIAMQHGMHYVYTGNIRDSAGASTYCTGCGRVLIGRDGYMLTQWQLDSQSRCEHCGTPCKGVFESTPGNWGPRRKPLNINAML